MVLHSRPSKRQSSVSTPVMITKKQANLESDIIPMEFLFLNMNEGTKY
jgi:hypothetical protein